MNEEQQQRNLPPDTVEVVDHSYYPTYHNWEKEIKRLYEAGVLRPGDALILNIAHDDWCGLYEQKRCNCDVVLQNRITGKVINNFRSG